MIVVLWRRDFSFSFLALSSVAGPAHVEWPQSIRLVDSAENRLRTEIARAISSSAPASTPEILLPIVTYSQRIHATKRGAFISYWEE